MKGVLVMMVICGCATPSSPPPAGETRSAKVDPQQLLATLQIRRAEVAQARSDEHVDRGHDLDLSPLLGLVREEFTSALGHPESCGTEEPISGACKTDVWEYVLFHLPETWVGGGTMLYLEFNTAGRCAFARWGGRK